MRITTHKTIQDWDDYIDHLDAVGVRELGNGYFSRVFQHPKLKDVAVKVVAGDEMYMKFLRFVMKNQGNPYLPRIYHITRHVSKGSTYFIVMMEKLSKLPFQKYRVWRKRLGTGNSMCQFEAKLQHLSVNCEDSHLRKIFKFIYKNHYYFDLHGNNVMRRGDQIVIVDPLADA